MDKFLHTRLNEIFLFKCVFLLLMFLVPCGSSAQTWTALGSGNEISSNEKVINTHIAVLDKVPYVAYRDGDISGVTAPVIVKKRNAQGTWEQVGGNIGTNAAYPRLYLDRSNNLYLGYVDLANGSRLAVRKYTPTSENKWEPLLQDAANLYASTATVNRISSVSQYSSTPRFSMAFDSDNVPYIAFGEGNDEIPYVRKFDGTAWVTVNGGPVNASLKAAALSLVIDEFDVPWVAFTSLELYNSSTGKMELYSGGSGTWTSAAANTISGIRHTSMVINSTGNFSIAYFNANTGAYNRATIITYDKIARTWGTSTAIASRDSPNITLLKDASGNLFCSFVDAMASTAVWAARVFKQNAGATSWVELKDPNIITSGIEENVGNLSMAIEEESGNPMVVYTNPKAVVRIFTPPPPPAVLTTTEPTDITLGSAVVGGNITADGGSPIAERGVVYGTGALPTISGSKVVHATGGIGVFSVTLNNLAPSTFYYARAYAINGGGVPTYGNVVHIYSPAAPDAVVKAPRQVELLDRGLVAVRKSAGEVYLSWRLLGTDPRDVGFNIYRDGTKINAVPITASTNYTHAISTNGVYTVRTVMSGVEGPDSKSATVWAKNQLRIPIQAPAAGVTPDNKAYTYSANDASVGDVDGDGEYEIILKWDPSVVNDNAGGYSGRQIYDCYKLNGTRLWRIDMGINVNAGPHYSPFMVYDFDGDGKAEIILKTADGTIDGLGNVIGNPAVDYRNTSGWVQQGPEFLTVFNGLTGAAMATVAYQPARGAISDWGDSYGNRADRFVSAVAYLDGVRPSIIVGRGYYDKLARAAYDWRDGKLTLRWLFNSKDPGLNAFSSMGNHQMTIGDIDGDGKDEIINGASAINDDGKGLWTTGKGHGDALHMTDMDPSRPGQEIWMCHESQTQYAPYGLRLYDAKTGSTIVGVATTGDVGRAMAADIDPAHPGYELWGSSGNLYNVKGQQISTNKPTYNFGIWWDGDLARELLDGTKLDKWNPTSKSLERLFTVYLAANIASNNSTKANPCLQADLFGDWREEIIYRNDANPSSELIIFTTDIPTDKRIPTLMHDTQYRTAVAWQNSGYNQPPYPSFFLGYNMPEPPVLDIYTLPVRLTSFKAKAAGDKVLLNWTTASEQNNKNFAVERSADGKNFESILFVNGAGNSNKPLSYSAVDHSPLSGTSYYRLRQTDFDGKSSVSEVQVVNILRKGSGLTLSPNPSSTEVKLNLDSVDDDLKLSVYDANGKVLLEVSGSLFEVNQRLNSILPSLPTGIYPVKVIDKNTTYTQKLIKQ